MNKELTNAGPQNNQGLSYGAFNTDIAVPQRMPENKAVFDFWLIITILSKFKWLILAITIFGTALTFAYVSRITPAYKSTTVIEFQKQEQQILGSDGAMPSVIADREYMETQFVILRSKALAERVAERLKLYKNPAYASQTVSKEEAIKQAAERVVQGVKVFPVPRTRIAKLEFVSESPQDAAMIANSVVENYIDSTLERKYNDTAYAREFLSERLALIKKNLEISERELVSYAKENGIFDLQRGSESSSLEINSIIALNDAYSKAQSRRIELEQNYIAMQSAPPIMTALENKNIQNLKAKRLDLVSRYNDLLSIYKVEYPDMIKLKKQIDELDQEIADEQANVLDSSLATSKAEFLAAKSKENSLAARVANLKSDLQGQQDSRIQYTILQREVDTARTQYEGLLQRLKDVTISSGVGASQVSVVDSAVPASQPFQPRLFISVFTAFLSSLLAGCGLAWGLYFIDDTIKTPEDIKRKLGLPTLAVVPKLSGKDALIVNQLSDPKSQVSEAFFSARTSIAFSTSGGTPKSILVTSTQPKEGKTSSSVALAVAFAKLGKKVLIIDADMRKPSFVADVENSIGLSGVLTSDNSLMDNVLESDLPSLYLLPSGIIPPNPAELLSGPRIQDIIKEAEDQFDIVIVDSPPLLSFTDAPSLAAICAGSVMVVRSGKIRTPAAQRTLSRLQESGANMLGVVLMQFDSKSAGYNTGYYYAYGYGAYSYGNERKSSTGSRRKILLFDGPLRQVDDASDSDEEPETDSDWRH